MTVRRHPQSDRWKGIDVEGLTQREAVRAFFAGTVECGPTDKSAGQRANAPGHDTEGNGLRCAASLAEHPSNAGL